jgi:hypothetical protein
VAAERNQWTIVGDQQKSMNSFWFVWFEGFICGFASILYLHDRTTCMLLCCRLVSDFFWSLLQPSPSPKNHSVWLCRLL